jgi:CspA family cold shock protein
MQSGTVKWFNNAKGYGFILPDNGGDELFAHYSAITMDGYKTLKAGQQVVFDVAKGDKGMHAVAIEPSAANKQEVSHHSTQVTQASSPSLSMLN